MRMAFGRKPYCSRKEMPKEKTKANAERVGKVTRVMGIRVTEEVN